MAGNHPGTRLVINLPTQYIPADLTCCIANPGCWCWRNCRRKGKSRLVRGRLVLRVKTMNRTSNWLIVPESPQTQSGKSGVRLTTAEGKIVVLRSDVDYLLDGVIDIQAHLVTVDQGLDDVENDVSGIKRLRIESRNQIAVSCVTTGCKNIIFSWWNSGCWDKKYRMDSQPQVHLFLAHSTLTSHTPGRHYVHNPKMAALATGLQQARQRILAAKQRRYMGWLTDDYIQTNAKTSRPDQAVKSPDIIAGITTVMDTTANLNTVTLKLNVHRQFRQHCLLSGNSAADIRCHAIYLPARKFVDSARKSGWRSGDTFW